MLNNMTSLQGLWPWLWFTEIKFLKESAAPWSMILSPSTFYYLASPHCPILVTSLFPSYCKGNSCIIHAWIHASMLSVHHPITILCVCMCMCMRVCVYVCVWDYLTSGHIIKLVIVFGSWHILTMHIYLCF